MFVSTSAATNVELLARPPARPGGHPRPSHLSSPLSRRGLVEVCEPIAAPVGGVAPCARVDLNGRTDQPQLQFIADPDARSLGKRLRQRDLEFPRHLRHAQW